MRRKLKKKLSGSITAPPDKSISHRRLLIAPFIKGRFVIQGLLNSFDIEASLRLVQSLGISVERQYRESLILNCPGIDNITAYRSLIDCGNSGTTARIGSGVLSNFPFDFTLTGDTSLSIRPMKRIIEPLSGMGVEFRSASAHGISQSNLTSASLTLPFTIRGGSNRGGKFVSNIGSAQIKSALLFAGLQAGKPTTIEAPLSRDHTEILFNTLGISINSPHLSTPARGSELKIRDEHGSQPSNNSRDSRDSKNSRCTITMQPVEKSIKPFEAKIPGDFSSAAFFIVASLTLPGSEIQIRRVNLNPTRTGLLTLLESMGAKLKIENRQIEAGESVGDITIKYQILHPLPHEVPPSIVPLMIDEFPLLAFLCATIPGEHKITNISELRVKECDRINAMTLTLHKLGVETTELEDGWIITGSDSAFNEGHYQTWGDHRIAMILKLASLKCCGTLTIDNEKCIGVSFPDFTLKLDSLLS